MEKDETKVISFLKRYRGEVACTVFLGILYTFLSFIIPFNDTPDEDMRYAVANYIYTFGKLPRGDEAFLVTTNIWGVSYAFTPYLSYIISALFMFLVLPFNVNERYLFHAARLSSVFSSVITIIFLFKISKALKLKNKYLLVSLVALLPQFSFISSYVNNDSLAVTSTAIIIYAWIIGLKSDWDKRSCIYLIVGLALCISSYYNAYGYVLISVVLFFTSGLYNVNKHKKSLKPFLLKVLFITLAVFLLSGWWFIKNYYYFGDFFARKTSRELSTRYAIPDLRPGNRKSLYSQGVPLTVMLFDLAWLRTSIRSFIGSFGYLKLFLPPLFNYLWALIIFFGLCVETVSIFKKHDCDFKKILFIISICFSIVLVIIISLFYSYFYDFQPQGRYLMPAVVPLMIWVAEGWEKFGERLGERRISDLIIISILYLNTAVIFIELIPYYF